MIPAPHGYNPLEGHDTDPWGERRRRRGEDIYGVITICSGIDGMNSGGVTSKGAEPGQAPQTLHVQALEGQCSNTAGGTNTNTMVPYL